MKKKPANMPRGKSTSTQERAVEAAERQESWLKRILRSARQARGRPDPERKR